MTIAVDRRRLLALSRPGNGALGVRKRSENANGRIEGSWRCVRGKKRERCLRHRSQVRRFNYAVGLYSLLGAVKAIEVVDDDDDDEEVVVPSKTRNSKRRKVESEEPASAPKCPVPHCITRQLASLSHDVRHIFLFIRWL